MAKAVVFCRLGIKSACLGFLLDWGLKVPVLAFWPLIWHENQHYDGEESAKSGTQGHA